MGNKSSKKHTYQSNVDPSIAKNANDVKSSLTALHNGEQSVSLIFVIITCK